MFVVRGTGFVLSDATAMSTIVCRESGVSGMWCMCVFGVRCVLWDGACLVCVSALMCFVCLWPMFGASFMYIGLLFRVSCRVSPVFIGLHLALLAVMPPVCVPNGHMLLFAGGLRSACACVSIFCRVAAP